MENTTRNNVKDSDLVPVVVRSEQILHTPAQWEGLVIGRVDTVEFRGEVRRVNFWYENRKLVKVA